MALIRSAVTRLLIAERYSMPHGMVVALPALWALAAMAVAAPAEAPVPVVTALAAREDVAVYVTGIGTVQAAQSVTVKARVDGQLEKVAFTEGQDVKAGELLAQIDPRPYQAQLDQALAQKAHDEASLGAALKDLDRYTQLVKQNATPQQTLDTQHATVEQLKASVQADQAQIANARVQLGYASIAAPISGRTGMRLLDAGNIVHASDATGLVIINQIDPIAVMFTLPEGEFQRVNQAMQTANAPLTVEALARDDGSTLGSGHLLLLNNQIDASTGTFQLKALFPNPNHKLWPGQYVDARLMLGVRSGAVTVPASALQRGPDGLLIYVVHADATVAAQPVRVGQTQQGKALIESGLAAGTRVVIDGQYKIRPGVTISEAPKSPAAPPGTRP